ncbi:MAG: phospho-N-acetylmuramoyl-pentapeptide-transferase [Alphaproteobacteria bacterium]|nr:phospho-N-acetylmuramoyl-pentapeptide-transferase [Alphaproteobacteria bacterium]
MLYNLLAPLSEDFILFNLFRYITFRAGAATITAFIIALVIGPYVIAKLKSIQVHGQPIRTDGPETHFKKAGTPTMGGIMVLIAVLLSTLLWADLGNAFIWCNLLVLVGFGFVGFLDDYKKLKKQNTKGVSGRFKMLTLMAVGFIAAVGISFALPDKIDTDIFIPFFKNLYIPLGFIFPLWAILVMVGASNAVNLTDGLDGLAIVPVALTAACLGLIAYLAGHAEFAKYLHISYVPGVGELTIICGALVGGALGFLWFNAPPAKIFMGDIGALSFGGVLGSIAISTKHEIAFAIIGGLFVIETLSVIIQVVSFKLTGKRVFLMAPLHHHFEKKGWSEPTVVIRFWIIAVIFALIGLSTLKLR